MSLKKIAVSNKQMPCEPLNHPKGWEIYNLPKRVKTASIEKSKTNDDLAGFDIESAVKEHPDHLYLKIFAIKEDEINDNADYFSAEELKKAAHTFVGVPIFTNHQNDDIEKARGECVHSWYDEDAKGIFIIARVDKVAYPKLARGIEEGYVKGTSMGCSVEHSICSICHNLAHTSDEYCSHIRNQKNRKFSGTVKCQYHKHGTEDNCPICSSSEKDAKTLKHAEQPVFEHNYGLKFIENSFVVNPACHSCGVDCVLHIPEVTKKVASLKASTEKLQQDYQNNPDLFRKAASNRSGKAIKVAGQQELNMLNDAMSNVEKVAKSMMSQKDHVDMEYVSDLVKAMADLQGVMDELTEMGYSQLPSPNIDAMSDVDGKQAAFPNQVDPAAFEAAKPLPQENTVPQRADSMRSDVIDGLGSITVPQKTSNKKKDFLQKSSKVIESLSALRKSTSNLINKTENNKVADTIIDVWADSGDPQSRRIIIDNEYVTEAQGEKAVKVTSISQFSKDEQDVINSDPKKFAENLLTLTTKESNSKMATEQGKTAQVGPNNVAEPVRQEIITEKQFEESAPTLHPRQGKSYETITQDQLGDSSNEMKDTTSDSPQTRQGTYEVITEGQFASLASSDGIVRWNDVPEVITEKQWTDASKAVRANLPDDWKQTITEDQLRKLLENHRFVGTYETITQDQLRNQDWGVKRWASKSYAANVLKVATQSIADAVSDFGLATSDVKSVVNEINDDSQKKNKVAFVTLLNSLPSKNNKREAIAESSRYLTKEAGKATSFDATESLIISVAQNAAPGIKVDDVYDSIAYAFGKKEAMAKVDKLIKAKESKPVKIANDDKFSALEDALNSLDGKYRLLTTVAEVGANPKGDKKKFVSACKKHAQALLEDELGMDAAEGLTILEIKLDPASGAIMIETGEGASLEEAEDLDFEEELDEVGTCPFDEGGETEELDDDFEDFVDDDDEDEDEDEDNNDDEFEDESSSGLTASSKQAKRKAKTPDTTTEDQLSDDTDEHGVKEARSKKRQKLTKQAQLMGGEMGGQGGASQAPGAGASLPQPPGSGADMPPVESFADEGEDMEEGMGDEDLMPKPPGSICPVCGSMDVDIVAGKGSCNNCSSEMIFKVSVEVTRWADLTDGKKDDEGEIEEGMEGEGFELEGSERELPVGAMVRVRPGALQKLASVKEACDKCKTDKDFEKLAQAVEDGGFGIPVDMLKTIKDKGYDFGGISPISGSLRTVKASDNTMIDLTSGSTYQVDYASANSGKDVYAQWTWTPRHPKSICPSCSRSRKALASALKEAGVSESKFDSMPMHSKADLLLKLKQSGALKRVKTASKNGSVFQDYKKAFGTFGDAFPTEACREKLARRYGENAIALSGPCEGEKLYDCVCNSLKSAGVYADGLAVKVAGIWSSEDGEETCITHQVQRGLKLREAAVACSALKTALASDEDLFADELGEETSFDDTDPFDDDPMGPEDFDSDPLDEVDPFDNETEGDTVTVELDADLAEQLDAQLDVALGDDVEDLAAEDHHDEETVEDIADDGVVNESEFTEDEPLNGDLSNDTLDEMKPMEDAGLTMGEENDEEKEGDSVKVVVNDKESPKDDEDLALKEGYPHMASSENNWTEKEARRNRSSFGGVGKIDMNLDSLLNVIQKQAGETEVSKERVQDSDDIGQYSEGKPRSGKSTGHMGHEDETIRDADEASAPRDKALMGHEDEDLNPQDKPLPHIPSDKGTMGHEDEVGLSGGDSRMTGGADGAGEFTDKEAAAKEKLIKELASMKGVIGNSNVRIDGLIERLAQSSKLNPPKPVSEDEDTKPHSTGKGMGHEENFSAEKPENTEGSGDESMMGHESETLENRPTSPEDHPEVAAGDQRMGHEEDDVSPEKQREDKGTVIAGSDAESGVQKEAATLRQKEALRVAGRMLEQGLIKASQLSEKVEELGKYESSQIKDFEKAIFASQSQAQKGLNTVSEGIERPLVINEAASARDNNQELSQKLAGLFTLHRQNEEAFDTPDRQVRETFGLR